MGRAKSRLKSLFGRKQDEELPSRTAGPDQSDSFNEPSVTEPQSLPAPEPQTSRAGLAPPAVAAERSRSVSPARTSTSDDRIANELWDEAYDKVKLKDTELATSYELILSDALSTQNAHQGTRDQNVIEQSDPEQRRLQMSRVVKHILDKNEKAFKREDRVQSVLAAASSLKDAVDAGIKVVPEAALAWAAVWAGVGLINTAIDESSAAQDGMEYVIKRMDWYTSLTSHLFSNTSRRFDGHESILLDSLRTLILDMYQTLLDFLMRAVCHLNKSYSSRVAGDTVRWSGWASGLQKLEKVERFTENKIDQFNQRQAASHIATLTSHQISKDYRDLMGMLRVPGMDHEMEDLHRRKNDLLEDSYRWILTNDIYEQFTRWGDHATADDSDHNNGSQVLWIRGDPGKGKTMLLVGIIKELKAALDSRAGAPDVAFFFCQATDSRLNTSISVLRGLLWMLIKQDERLNTHLDELRQYGPDVFAHETAFRILRGILENIFKDPRFTPTYLIIDALDECRGDESSPGVLVEFMNESAKAYPGVIKWLVSSRNESDLNEQLEHHTDMSLSLEINDKSVGEAVKAFIDVKMEGLAQVWRNKNKSRGGAGQQRIEEIKRDMAEEMNAKAEGTFLWVALVFKQIGSRSAQDALKQVKQQVSGLRSIYAGMMDRILRDDELLLKCRHVLLVLVNAYRPPKVSELVVLAGLDDLDYHEDIIRSCGLLTISHEDGTVHFVHQSAKDFLTANLDDESNRQWSDVLNRIFENGDRNGHEMMVENSLTALRDGLRRNIYDLSSDTVSVEEAIAHKPNPDPLDRLGYASTYWINHVVVAMTDRSSITQAWIDLAYRRGHIYRFLETKFLVWLESLSLLGDVSKSAHDITNLAACIDRHLMDGLFIPALAGPVSDARRFILAHRAAIENYPLQIYSSLLLFSPSASIVKGRFRADEPSWVSLGGDGVDDQWDNLLHVLEGHSSPVESLALSSDNQFIATGDRSGIIKIWERMSGRCVSTTRAVVDASSSSWIIALTFSRNAQLLAVAQGYMIAIVDTRTTEIVRSFKIPNYPTSGMKFSADDANILLYSAVRDQLEIWTTQGQHLGMIEPATVPGCWALSDDAALFLSVNRHHPDIVVIWDTYNRQVVSQWSTGDSIDALTISHDSKLVASWSSELISIWDRKNQTRTAVFTAGTCFPGESRLFFTSDTFYIAWIKIVDRVHRSLVVSHIGSGRAMDWLKATRTPVPIFTDDDKQVILGYSGNTVAIWELKQNKTPEEVSLLSTPSTAPRRMTSVLISGHKYIISLPSRDLEDEARLWDLKTGKLRASIDGLAKDSEVRAHARGISFIRPDGIHVLDMANTEAGETNRILEGKFQKHCSSHDGTMVATMVREYNDPNIVVVWNVHDETKRFTESVGTRYGTSQDNLCFTADDKYLLYYVHMEKVLIWDMEGKCVYTQTFNAQFNTAMSLKSKLVIAGLSTKNPIPQSHTCPEVRDIASEDLRMQLKCDCNEDHRGIAMSSDERLIALSSRDKTLRIFSAESGHCVRKLVCPGTLVTMSFNLDNSLLHTSYGSIILDLEDCKDEESASSRQATFRGLNLSPDLSWIFWDNERLLFLPQDYRPNTQDSFYYMTTEPEALIGHNTIVLRRQSTKVVTLHFNEEVLP